VTDTRARQLVRRLPPPAARAARRVRRQVAGWTAPALERDLRAARRELEATRAKLRKVQEELREARRRLSEVEFRLPAELEETIARVREEHLTYLKPPHLRSLAAAVLEAERDGIPGLIIEAGTARGGSAIVMAAAKSPDRPMKVYDVFGMIPPPTDQDGADVHERYRTITEGKAHGVGGELYYGYRDDLKGEVAASFSRHGLDVDDHRIELVQGLFQDTIHLDEPVAVAHLDGDWYESTMTCLERIAPLIVPGGRLIFDDYSTWSGCRTAVDEYFAGNDGFELRHGAKLHAVRR
jgi:O-methyltransferase